MQTINQRNDKGNREGYWEESYYSNGNLCAKGFYKDGKPVGDWECYWSNGNLMFKGSYKDGKLDGYWEEYNSDSTLKQTEFYANN